MKISIKAYTYSSGILEQTIGVFNEIISELLNSFFIISEFTNFGV
jgi:hypothetical protein